MEYDEIFELCHHGIKGQRWGIRRYQNEDGTLTEEGKKRYGSVGLKEVSLNTIEKDREKYKQKLLDSTADIRKAKKLEDQAIALAKKYDFDPDDGGGGSTKAAQEAGIKYMDLWEEAARLRAPYEIGGSKYNEYHKLTNDYLTKKYGTYRMNMLKTKDVAPVVAAGVSITALLLAGIGGFVYMVRH